MINVLYFKGHCAHTVVPYFASKIRVYNFISCKLPLKFSWEFMTSVTLPDHKSQSNFPVEKFLCSKTAACKYLVTFIHYPGGATSKCMRACVLNGWNEQVTIVCYNLWRSFQQFIYGIYFNGCQSSAISLCLLPYALGITVNKCNGVDITLTFPKLE